ncbi:MAG: Panacea domain-containing protein [Hyphomicrobiales bacterium]
MKAKELSKYIIAKSDNFGDLITNKKLQKLLYYIEAWFLVHIDSIIDEDFEAWIHGPVIPNVYHKYKEFGYSPIKIKYQNNEDSSGFIKEFEQLNELDDSAIELINLVLTKYGELSSQQLELLSHSEDPWKLSRGEYTPFDHCNEVISKDQMKIYYSSLIV